MKTLALINPISGHGHLDSWHALFVEAFLRRGYRVIAITPLGNRLRSRISTDASPSMKHRLFIGGMSPDAHRKKLPLRVRVLKEIVRIGRHVPNRMVQERAESLLRRFPSRGRGGEGIAPLALGAGLNACVASCGIRPDAALVMYMDSMATLSADWRHFEEACGVSWAGIHFTGMSFTAKPGDEFYDSPGFSGLALLSDDSAKRFAEWFPGKRFVAVPDVTYAGLPKKLPGWLRNALRRSRGRKVIVCGGSMTGRKNIAFLRRVMERLDPAEWFLLMVGRPYKNTFNHEDLAFWQDAEFGRFENVFVMPEFIDDERDFNAMISHADVIFAAYRDFNCSSNMLSKAATFEKPVVVPRGTYIGEEVVRYGIGVAVALSDAEQAAESMSLLVRQPPIASAFAKYRSEIKTEGIVDCLEPLLWPPNDGFLEVKER